MRRSCVIALYGRKSLLRAYCKDCHANAFVIDGKFACCDRATTVKPKRVRRESEPEWKRYRLKVGEKKQILAEQENRCIYCERQFGSIVHRRGRELRLQIHWDHSVPFAFSQDSSADNMVAACHVCNRSKTDKLFDTLEAAQVALRDLRRVNGYDF